MLTFDKILTQLQNDLYAILSVKLPNKCSNVASAVIYIQAKSMGLLNTNLSHECRNTLTIWMVYMLTNQHVIFFNASDEIHSRNGNLFNIFSVCRVYT